MPRLDQTGPMGQGPLTGWGLGRCGRGFGSGRGAGYGYGGRLYYSKKEERDVLAEDIEALEADLKAAKERLAEIESK